MVLDYVRHRASYHDLLCILMFLLRALGEVIGSVASHPFRVLHRRMTMPSSSSIGRHHHSSITNGRGGGSVRGKRSEGGAVESSSSSISRPAGGHNMLRSSTHASGGQEQGDGDMERGGSMQLLQQDEEEMGRHGTAAATSPVAARATADEKLQQQEDGGTMHARPAGLVDRRGHNIVDVACMDTDMNRRILASCPSLEPPMAFRPLWWTLGGHAQTLIQACLPTPPSKYRREMFTLEYDGVQVALDWKEDPLTMHEVTPLVLVLHGMGGSSESKYMQYFTHGALVRGYRSVVYNRRGHGDTSLLPPSDPNFRPPPGPPPHCLPETSEHDGRGSGRSGPLSMNPFAASPPTPLPVATTAGGQAGTVSEAGTVEEAQRPPTIIQTALPVVLPKVFPKHSNMDDMMAVVEHLRNRYPKAPMYLIGFSCGGNLAINYLAASAAVATGKMAEEAAAAVGKDEGEDVGFPSTGRVVPGVAQGACSSSFTQSLSSSSCPFIASASVSNGYEIWNGVNILREKDWVIDGIGAKFLKDLLLSGRMEEVQHLAKQHSLRHQRVGGGGGGGGGDTGGGGGEGLVPSSSSPAPPSPTGGGDCSPMKAPDQTPSSPPGTVGAASSNPLTPLSTPIKSPNKLASRQGTPGVAGCLSSLSGLPSSPSHSSVARNPAVSPSAAADLGNLDFKAILKSKSALDLEAMLVVPAYGYKDVKEYYHDDECSTKIQSVRSPLLCVTCLSDPMVHNSLLSVPLDAARANPHIITTTTRHGGHMGWVEGLTTEPWYIRLYFEYIEAVTNAKAEASATAAEAAATAAPSDSVSLAATAAAAAAAAAGGHVSSYAAGAQEQAATCTADVTVAV